MPEIGTSTFTQVNPTLEWPHKAMNKLDPQQRALAQAPGEGFWQTCGRKLMAQNIMDGGDVRSGCVLTTLKNKINLLRAQKPAKGRCMSLMSHISLDLHIVWALLPAFRAGMCLVGCQVDNPSSQSLHLFGEHLHHPICVTEKPFLTEKPRECVPCSFPSLIVQPTHTCLC